MKVVNKEFVTGYKITEDLGVVSGNTVRAKHIGGDIASSFKHIVGGEMGIYTEMMTQARTTAYEKMIFEAKELGADGIVNIRFTSATVAQGAAEILVYGTAVKLEKE